MTEKLTLLQRFLKKKVAQYPKPQRKGTPKGAAIGLSVPKYQVSLMMLTNDKLKDIARNLGISYGLVRKWRTEPAFMKVVQEHYAEFASFAAGHIVVRLCEKDMLDDETILKKPIAEICVKNLPKYPPSGVNLASYHPDLLLKIDEELEKRQRHLIKEMSAEIKAKRAPLLLHYISLELEQWSGEIELAYAKQKPNILLKALAINKLERTFVEKDLFKLRIIQTVLTKPKLSAANKKYMALELARLERNLTYELKFKEKSREEITKVCEKILRKKK